jgi:hypothetical protein
VTSLGLGGLDTHSFQGGSDEQRGQFLQLARRPKAPGRARRIPYARTLFREPRLLTEPYPDETRDVPGGFPLATDYATRSFREGDSSGWTTGERGSGARPIAAA